MAKQERERPNIVPVGELEPAAVSISAARRFRISANPPTPLLVCVAEIQADDESRALAAFKQMNGVPTDGSIAGVIDIQEL